MGHPRTSRSLELGLPLLSRGGGTVCFHTLFHSTVHARISLRVRLGGQVTMGSSILMGWRRDGVVGRVHGIPRRGVAHVMPMMRVVHRVRRRVDHMMHLHKVQE